jgi:hypothetical protein
VKFVLIVLALAMLAVYACTRHRSRPPISVDLAGIAEIQLRPDLRLDPRDTTQSGDKTTFHFRRVNDTHLNGQTSYAELLTLSLLAEDLPAQPSLTTEETIYEQHPVKEPAWRIRLTDPHAGIALDWQGYRKHYSAAQAKAYVQQIAASLRWKQNRAAHFQSHRDWSTANWPAVYRRNLQLLNAALAAHHLPPAAEARWTTHGDWRYIVDNERPQQFHLVRAIAHIALPDGPFRLHAPLTYFRYFHTRGFWHQDNQGHGGAKIPASVLPAFQQELTNAEHVYFYRIQSLHLWKEHPSLADALHTMLAEANRAAEDFHTKGAIDADAEP